MEKRDKFFESYRRKIEAHRQNPPESVWDNIANELDVDEVWDRVVVELDRPSSGWFRKVGWAIPALLLLLMGGGALYHVSRKELADQKNVIAQQDNNARRVEDSAKETSPVAGNHRSEENRTEASRDKTIPSISEDDATEAHREERRDSAPMNTEVTRASGNTEAKKASDEISRIAEELIIVADERIAGEGERRRSLTGTISSVASLNDYGDARLSPLIVPDSMLRVREPSPTLTETGLAANDNAARFRRSLYVGVNGGVKNTWLLNRNTLTGLEKKTLLNTRLDFGRDFGVIVTYELAPVWQIQAEAGIAEMGQRYDEYRNGRYISHEIDLEYFQTSLIAKYSPGRYRWGVLSNAHAAFAGVFHGTLRKADDILDGKSAAIQNTYNTYNFGLVIGYEFNRHILPRLEFSTGLRVNLGLGDIGADEWVETRTGSLSLNLALKYRL